MQTARNRYVRTYPMRAVRPPMRLQRFLRAGFDADLAGAPCFFAAPRAARASLTAAVCAGAAFLRRPPALAAPPAPASTGGNDRTRAPPLSPDALSARAGRLAGGLMGVSR